MMCEVGKRVDAYRLLSLDGRMIYSANISGFYFHNVFAQKFMTGFLAAGAENISSMMS